MLGLLPDLTPLDSQWYQSSRNPAPQHHQHQHHQQDQLQPSNSTDHPGGGIAHHHHQHNRRYQNASFDRSPLARLRADEQYMERRRKNVARFGQTWLKPPGVAKTLYQMEEERREMEEHQEALRREQLAQELADAEMEAAVAAAAAAAAEAVTRGAAAAAAIDEMDGQQPGAILGGPAEAGGGTMMERNLDDEIPEASEAGGLDYSALSDDPPSNSSDEDGEDGDNDGEDTDIRRRAEQERHAQSLRAARAGMNHDAFREAIANPGSSIGGDMHGDEGYDDGDDDDDDDDHDHGDVFDEDHGAGHMQGTGAGGQLRRQGRRRRTNLFEEEDLNLGSGDEMEVRMMMQQDLDDEIPDADNAETGVGGYEHTDSEAEVTSSSSDGGREDESYLVPTMAAAAAAAASSSSSSSSRYHQHQQYQHHNRSYHQQQQQQHGGDAGGHSSMDLSSILSQDSSMVESYGAGVGVAGSSPAMRRGSRRGPG